MCWNNRIEKWSEYIAYFRISGLLIDWTYGEMLFGNSGINPIVLSPQLPLYITGFQFPEAELLCLAQVDVVKEAEMTEREDVRRSYRLRLIIHGLSALSEGVQRWPALNFL